MSEDPASDRLLLSITAEAWEVLTADDEDPCTAESVDCPTEDVEEPSTLDFVDPSTEEKADPTTLESEDVTMEVRRDDSMLLPAVEVCEAPMLPIVVLPVTPTIELISDATTLAAEE